MNQSYFFLLVLVSYAHGQSLTSSGSEVKKPGESVTLSCVVSGLSLSWLHWIRQKPGKGLEWIGRIDSGTGTIFAQSLQGQFSITKDTSKNMVYLEIKSLKTEDTAIYYCARESHCDAFDYWGKGTQVIVTNEVPKAPNVFMMSPCESSSGSLLVGCLATGFAPTESVNFKWMDQRGNSLTNFIQYPTVGTGNKMMKVSHITINETEWNQSEIICEARHPSNNVKEKFITVKPQDPTLSLVLVTTQKSTSVMCVIEDFYPKKIDVQWKVNNINSMSQVKLEHKLNDTGHYTAYSFYEVSSENWDVNTQYTCEVTHRGKLFTMKANFNAKFALTLKPPIQKEIFVNNKVVLEAVVSGDIKETVEKASVSCSMKEARIDVSPGTVHFSNDISQSIKIHKVTVDTEKWFDGEVVTCTIHDTNNNRGITQKISFDKGDGVKPNVTIYKPDGNLTKHVSHVCEVTSRKLGDVYVMWKLGDESYREVRTFAPIHQNGFTSVFNILTMSRKEYENPSTTITCAVIHANMDNRSSPLQVSTSKSESPEPETGFALDCNKDVLEEDEFRSLWSTATSFIFLFLFSLTYSAVLSFFKVKQ
ncbi:immunoglobulin gamma-1 heavy chain-like isoform X3 [Carassius carassius]|uniref:immunoglobulin gamma-1 heavy chain-like isoform X3 n=1 Tax=Carassius carassius TaxID=217509 RepID=UPI0028687287|nr:immunoglobulin gamma-1 heavy chain-like isoform X3 [Carassius carassius]